MAIEQPRRVGLLVLANDIGPFLKKMGQPRPLFIYFRSCQQQFFILQKKL